MVSFRDKVVLITGASEGLGLALAREFFSQGARLAIVSRRATVLEGQALSLDPAGERVKPFTADLTRVDEIPGLVSRVEEAFTAPVDVLVHNAAVSCFGEVESCPFDALNAVWSVNFSAGVRLVQAVVGGMKERRCGQIIWIGSASAFRAVPFSAVYGASKAAARAFSESLRGELRDFNIGVLLVLPGALDTGFHTKQVIYTRRLGLRKTGAQASPEILARAILQAAHKHKDTLVFGRNAKILQHLSYWAPRLVDYLYRIQLGKQVTADPVETGAAHSKETRA
jgi:short-subunit dehydrogenase